MEIKSFGEKAWETDKNFGASEEIGNDPEIS